MATKVAIQIAARIVQERDKRGWTDAELARRLKTQRSRVHDLTHATHEPRLKILRKVATVFGIDLADLFEAA